MLCKMKEILDDAQKKGYGVAYFKMMVFGSQGCA